MSCITAIYQLPICKGHLYFCTSLLYFHTNLEFCVIKKTKNTFSFFSHSFCLSWLCNSPTNILFFPTHYSIHPYHFPSYYFTFLFLFSSAVNMISLLQLTWTRNLFLLVSPYFIYLEIYWYTTFCSFFFIFLFDLIFFVYHYFDLKNYIFWIDWILSHLIDRSLLLDISNKLVLRLFTH